MSLDVRTSTDLLAALRDFDLSAKKFIIKPNFTQVCAGTTDAASLELLFKVLVEQPHRPEVWLAEIPNINAPPLREVIRGLGLEESIRKHGIKVDYLDEAGPEKYEEFSPFRIARPFLGGREARVIVIAPPKEHAFLPGGVSPFPFRPYLKGYSGIMKNFAIGVLHKEDKRKTHGVTPEMRDKHKTENLRMLWEKLSEEEKMLLQERHNRIVSDLMRHVFQSKDIFILTKQGLLEDHLNGTRVQFDEWVVGYDPTKVDQTGAERLANLKRKASLT